MQDAERDGPSLAERISEALDARKEETLAYLLPNGRKVGHEYHAGSLAGEAGDSLKVHLNGKGCVWCDFATGDKGADLLDLWDKPVVAETSARPCRKRRHGSG